MTKNFETKMTIAAGFVNNRTNDLDGLANDLGSYDLPRPEGRGWQLKQVIPVHNNVNVSVSGPNKETIVMSSLLPDL